MSRSFGLLVLFGFVVLAAGCRILPAPQADAARFYTLGEKISTPAATSAAPAAGALRLGVARVELPAYLQNRAMVVRYGSEVRYEQNQRWAEPLDEAVARIIRARLLATPSVASVYATPFPLGQSRDYDVVVRVMRCEGVMGATGGGTAELVAVVEIIRYGPNGATVARWTLTLPASWDGKDFPVLAERLGAAAAALGDEIAKSVTNQ